MEIIVECSEKSIMINEKEIEFPIHLNSLIEILGEPSRREFDMFWRVIWDDLGIFTDYPTWDYIVDIRFLTSHDHKLKHAPKSLFKGNILLIDKKKGNDLGNNISLKKNQIKKMTFKGGKEPYCVAVGKNFAYEEKLPKNKYLIKPLNEEVIEFEDFGFKIAVIQELMYEKKLLKPKFDLYEFVKSYKKRKIDLEMEGYEPIEEVTQYFKDLPIPKRFAPELTEIVMDGGNKIYTQLICFPEGDEDYWEIKSVSDVKHFPNLKKCICIAKNEIIEELKKLGIEVSRI
jgi:hypothetical protein